MASNRSFNLIAPGSYTGVQETAVHPNLNNPSGHFVTKITSLSSGQYLVLNVIGVTETGAEYNIFTSLPMNQVTTYRYVMGPNYECVPGIACRDFLPAKIKFRLTPALPLQTDSYSFDLQLGLG